MVTMYSGCPTRPIKKSVNMRLLSNQFDGLRNEGVLMIAMMIIPLSNKTGSMDRPLMMQVIMMVMTMLSILPTSSIRDHGLQCIATEVFIVTLEVTLEECVTLGNATKVFAKSHSLVECFRA